MRQTFMDTNRQSLVRHRATSRNRHHQNDLTPETLVGSTVFNYQNDKLGRIKEVLLDPDNGDIACVMLSYGGFLGVGTHILPISRPGFAFHITEKHPLLDIELEQIRSPPPALGWLASGARLR